jgi:hypothetical protein
MIEKIKQLFSKPQPVAEKAKIVILPLAISNSAASTVHWVVNDLAKMTLSKIEQELDEIDDKLESPHILSKSERVALESKEKELISSLVSVLGSKDNKSTTIISTSGAIL